MQDMRRWGPAARALLAAGLVSLLGACARPRAPDMLPPPVTGHEETGLASWYGEPYDGRRTASGEIYDMSQMTAAHQTLPFGTWLLVENLGNGRSAIVRVNDRGPFIEGRIIDLSYGAAKELDMLRAGIQEVECTVIR